MQVAPAAAVPAAPAPKPSTAAPTKKEKGGRIEIEPVEGGLEAIISKLKPE